jgi:hypothetical protein
MPRVQETISKINKQQISFGPNIKPPSPAKPRLPLTKIQIRAANPKLLLRRPRQPLTTSKLTLRLPNKLHPQPGNNRPLPILDRIRPNLPLGRLDPPNRPLHPAGQIPRHHKAHPSQPTLPGLRGQHLLRQQRGPAVHAGGAGGTQPGALL